MRNQRVRLATAVAVIVALIGLGGCSSSSPEAAAGEPFVYSPSTIYSHLYPTATPAAYPHEQTMLLFDGLTRINPESDYSVEPALASSWEVSADGLEYAFTLRDDVFWHDGEPFDAADVVFTYDVLLDPNQISAAGADFLAVADVVAEDEHTVVFTLVEPYAPFLSAAAIGIMPEHVLAEQISDGTLVEQTDFARAPVGTGAYRFVSFEDDSLVLQANDQYFGGKPSIEDVVMVFIEDPNTRLARLAAGDLDAAALPASLLSVLPDDAVAVTLSSVSPQGLLANLEDETVADPHVRRALNFFTDEQALLSALAQGNGSAVSSPLVNSAWSSQTGDEFTYDPKTGANELILAGWELNSSGRWERDGVELTFTITDSYEDGMAELIAASWEENGVTTIVEVGDSESVTAEGATFQFITTSLGAAADPDFATWNMFHSTATIQNGGWNLGGYANAAVDDALDRGRAAAGADERATAYADLEAALLTDPAYVWGLAMDQVVAFAELPNEVSGDIVVGETPSFLFFNFADWVR